MKKNIIVLSFLFIVSAFHAFSQRKVVDSLVTVLKNNDALRAKLHKTTYDKSDTQRVNVLVILCRELINMGQHEKAKQYADEAMMIAPKIGFKRGEYDAYNNTGVSYFRQGDFPNALNNLFIALKIGRQIAYKNKIANTLNNIAIVYSMQSNYPEALKYNLDALKIREELGDKAGMAMSYNNLGMISTNLGNDSAALKYHSAALKIREELGDKRGLVNSYTNFGNIYNKGGNTSEALKNYFKELKISEELEDEPEIAIANMNIGAAYYLQSNFTEASKYNHKALKMLHANGDKYSEVSCLINEANILEATNNLKDEKKYLDSAIALSKEIGANNLTRDAYKILSNYDSVTGNWQDAYIHHKLYILNRDSIMNDDNTEKIVKTQMQYEFDKKQAAQKAEDEKKELAYQKELALKALQYEYQKKQATARSEEERQKLRYEEKIKEQQLSYEYDQKIIKAETKQKNQQVLNKMLSSENKMMLQKHEDEKKIRWMMIVALTGFTAFGFTYFNNFKKQQKANLKIVQQSEELKTLMREVHHRVKNNLQLIISMLRMQARNIEDHVAIDALVNSENRLQTISMVHEKLYKSKNISNILLKDYLEELMNALVKQHQTPGQEFSYTIIDNSHLVTNLDTAIPLGLIVNELVTNSFKYAFSNTTSGSIEITLNQVGGMNNYQLVFKDNGSGFSISSISESSNSLGIKLIRLFAEQLNGSLSFRTDNGACSTVDFKLVNKEYEA